MKCLSSYDFWFPVAANNNYPLHETITAPMTYYSFFTTKYFIDSDRLCSTTLFPTKNLAIIGIVGDNYFSIPLFARLLAGSQHPKIVTKLFATPLQLFPLRGNRQLSFVFVSKIKFPVKRGHVSPEFVHLATDVTVSPHRQSPRPSRLLKPSPSPCLLRLQCLYILIFSPPAFSFQSIPPLWYQSLRNAGQWSLPLWPEIRRAGDLCLQNSSQMPVGVQ